MGALKKLQMFVVCSRMKLAHFSPLLFGVVSVATLFLLVIVDSLSNWMMNGTSSGNSTLRQI